MKLRERKQIIFKRTQEIFEKYEKKGLLSIYWYGSGLNDKDFSKNSDIDLIGIVNDKFNMKDESNMKLDLQEYEDLDIRINVYYLSELNNGKIRGNIAKFLPIKLWLMDFEKYIYLHGQKYSETDFKMKKANFQEAIEIEYKMFEKSKENFLKDNSLGMYYIKAALYYFYYRACLDRGYYEFSYHNISQNALDEHSNIIKKLVKIKSENYDIKNIKEIMPELDKLVLKVF